MPRSNTAIQLQLWKERLEQFNHSGQSVQKYCESTGCTPASFYYWKRKVATASQPGVNLPASGRSAFVPIVVRDNRASRVLVNRHMLRLAEMVAEALVSSTLTDTSVSPCLRGNSNQ